MEGWVDLRYPAMHRPGVELAIFRSLVRRPTTTLPSQPCIVRVCFVFWRVYYLLFYLNLRFINCTRCFGVLIYGDDDDCERDKLNHLLQLLMRTPFPGPQYTRTCLTHGVQKILDITTSTSQRQGRSDSGGGVDNDGHRRVFWIVKREFAVNMAIC